MYKNKNYAKSLLATGLLIGGAAVSVTVGEGSLFPATGSFVCVIWGAAYQSPLLDADREIIVMSLTAGDTFSISSRGAEGTVAKAWSINDNIALILSAGKFDELERYVQDGLISFGIVTGTNSYSIALDPPLSALTHGTKIRGLFTNGSTSTCTLNVNGLGAKKLYYVYNAVYTQCDNSTIISGTHMDLSYDTGLDTGVGGWIITNGNIRSVSNLLSLFSDVSTVNTLLGNLVSTNSLEALKVLTPAANKLPYFTGALTADTILLTTLSKAILAANDTSTILKSLGMVGMQVMWSNSQPPVGWLECNGSSISRITYADLFAVIGTMYGSVDVNSFNIPDWRGTFPRGWAHGSANDPDRATRTNRGDGVVGDFLGTKQAHMYGSHQHSITQAVGYAWYVGYPPPGNTGSTYGAYNTSLAGGNETRPINMNTMFIIKY